MYYIDANDSSEDEAERWEREQLRKAVGYKKVSVFGIIIRRLRI